MRKMLLIVTAAAVAAVLVDSLGATADGRRSPALRLVDREPITLTGVRFRGRELVRVEVSADGGAATRRVRSTAAGAFTARFAQTLDRCGGLYAHAVGSRGSRAKLKLPQPLCPPSL
jgi:hypothetical protein